MAGHPSQQSLGSDVGSLTPALGSISHQRTSHFTQSSSIWSGTGVPAATLGNNGDFYFRSDAPGTANQRIYVKSAGAWVGIV